MMVGSLSSDVRCTGEPLRLPPELARLPWLPSRLRGRSTPPPVTLMPPGWPWLPARGAAADRCDAQEEEAPPQRDECWLHSLSLSSPPDAASAPAAMAAMRRRLRTASAASSPCPERRTASSAPPLEPRLWWPSAWRSTACSASTAGPPSAVRLPGLPASGRGDRGDPLASLLSCGAASPLLGAKRDRPGGDGGGRVSNGGCSGGHPGVPHEHTHPHASVTVPCVLGSTPEAAQRAAGAAAGVAPSARAVHQWRSSLPQRPAAPQPPAAPHTACLPQTQTPRHRSEAAGRGRRVQSRPPGTGSALASVQTPQPRR
jgi:hypothetical protein